MSMGLHRSLNRHSSDKHYLILTKTLRPRGNGPTPVYTELTSVISDSWRCISDGLEMLRMGVVALKPYIMNSRSCGVTERSDNLDK